MYTYPAVDAPARKLVHCLTHHSFKLVTNDQLTNTDYYP